MNGDGEASEQNLWGDSQALFYQREIPRLGKAGEVNQGFILIEYTIHSKITTIRKNMKLMRKI
jgi:hypothetical protein